MGCEHLRQHIYPFGPAYPSPEVQLHADRDPHGSLGVGRVRGLAVFGKVQRDRSPRRHRRSQVDRGGFGVAEPNPIQRERAKAGQVVELTSSDNGPEPKVFDLTPQSPQCPRVPLLEDLKSCRHFSARSEGDS